MSSGIRPKTRRARLAISSLRAWLRRVMPRVGVASIVLCLVWLTVHDLSFYREHDLFSLFGLATFCAVAASLIYFGLKLLRWSRRRLLWRVRRRLLVTFLFVGLTPIVLLVVLGALAGFSIVTQALARIVTVRLNTTEQQAMSDARALGDALSRLPPNTGDGMIGAWLDDRVRLLQPSLPGARVSVWRGVAPADAPSLGSGRRADFVAGSEDESTRGVGSAQPDPGAPLPEWLQRHKAWSGVAFSLPPAGSDDLFGSPSIRAVVRGTTGGRPFVLLMVVPISRALLSQLGESTGIRVRPFFVSVDSVNLEEHTGKVTTVTVERRGGQPTGQGTPESDLSSTDGSEPRAVNSGKKDAILGRDQFGDPLDGLQYPVILTATNWQNGASSSRPAFLFSLSLAEVREQIIESNTLGALLRRLLIIVGAVFLVLELLALLAAAWMTRAVTGTVHKLYRATTFIKQGDFSHRVRVRSHDQLGELAEAFNEMSSNIESLLHERVERERLEREVEIAAEVQAQLFPRHVPDLSTVEMTAECRAARGVAGDYYDYVEITPALVAIALGDVSGKGISAALVMSNLQASLRAQTAITAERLSMAERVAAVSAGGSISGGQALAHVVAGADLDGAVSRMTGNINGQLSRSTDANRFATLFLALYEDDARTLRYTNAGHNAPILVRTDGSVERLSTGGMMAGAFDWAEYEEGSTGLAPGDVLAVFSDGLTEALRPDGEEYGESRLVRLVVEQRGLSADELRSAIFAEIDAWSGSGERGDDQTLVIVKAKA